MAGESPNLGYVKILGSENDYGTITAVAGTGEIKEGTVAAQLPNVPCKLVMFKAFMTNTGDVYIGGSGVTVEGTVTNTTTGFKLEPGETFGWVPTSNVNLFWTVGEGTTDLLNYLALS